MQINRFIKSRVEDALFQIKATPQAVLLEKENIKLLEQILERESAKLCPREEFELLGKEVRTYSQEQFNEMLHNAKDFVDNILDVKCSTPKIGHFSFRHKDSLGLLVLSGYASSIGALFSSMGAFFIHPIIGAALLPLPPLFYYCSRLIHNDFAKSSRYAAFSNRLVIEPTNQFCVQGTIAHEYVHHIFFEKKIFDNKVDEGFARNIQRLYNKRLAELNNDERYMHQYEWWSCIEINNAYRYACSITGRKAFDFKKLSGDPNGQINSYTLGGALFRLMEERHGTNAYRNFMSTYQFSRALCYL